MTQYPAIVIANEIIKLANVQDIPVTPMKLQKILYLAYGIGYKRLNEKIISERFEAWDYGPVIPSIYNAFKVYKSAEIKDIYDELIFTEGYNFVSPLSIKVDDQTLSVIREAWDSAKNLTAFTLSAWSHTKNSPWDKAYNAKPKEPYISDDEIKLYFNSFIVD